MSSSRFAQKRIGYVAVSQSFNEHTPVLLLITNQLRKDLGSANEFEAALALDCLANIATVDLARDLTPEVFTLLGSSKISVRKKAIGVILRVFEKYPDAVRVCFKRLVENLDSPDSRILSAAVGVFCELASRDPRSYLPLAPEFYRVLVDSKNNWVLIKILKIFAKLAALEPRLAKRVVEPICDHMGRTGAKSLMFECIRTVVSSLSEYESAVKLAVSKIRELLMDEDPNLKYLGLHALSIVAPKHPWVVLENQEIVIKSLSDADSNIRSESLRLVMAAVSKSNVVEISRVLLSYGLKSDPDFCNEILGSILSACSQNFYEIVMDFDWYVSLLGEMSRIPHCQKGEDIENQLIDIGLRVRDARPELIRVGRSLLIDPALLGNPFLYKILCAAAWVCGEYVEFSTDPFELVEALLQPRTSLLPPLIRAVYLQSVLKVLTFCLHSYLQGESSVSSPSNDNLESVVSEGKTTESSDLLTPAQDDGFNPRISEHISYEDLPLENNGDNSKFASFEKNRFTQESIVNLLNLIELALKPLLGTLEVEILERARNILGLIELVKQHIPSHSSPKEESLSREESEVSKLIRSINDAFCEELGPVSFIAQEKIHIPEGLVLKENLKELDLICGDFQPPSSSFFPQLVERMEESLVSDLRSKDDLEPSNESTSLLIEHRKRHGLYYLTSTALNDYPLANDLISGEHDHDETDDLVRLAAQSLAPKKKPNYLKPRPVVVRLDEGEGTIPVASKKPGSKYDLLSGVVQDVLQETNPMDKSPQKGKEKVSADAPLGSKENLQDAEDPRREKSGSGKSKQRSHGKERRHKDPNKVHEEKDENSERRRKKSSHRHGRKRTSQRAEGQLDVAAQMPVIPDFLL